MKRSIVFIAAILLATSLLAQVPVGKWRDHYSYIQGKQTAASASRLFLAANNGIFWHNPQEGSIGKLSTVNGLSDVGVSAIGYSPFQKMLMVGYENGNIDIVLDNKIVNLPYISQSIMQGEKQINHFYFVNEDEVMVSTSFGIVVVNTTRYEIKDTYYIGSGGSSVWVNQVEIFNGTIYAATQNGLYKASANDPLLIHYERWNIESAIPGENNNYTSLANFNNNLVALQSTGSSTPDVFWYNDQYAWSQISNEMREVSAITANNEKFVAISREGLATYYSVHETPSIVNSYGNLFYFRPNWGTLDANGNLLIADDMQGLVYQSSNGWHKAHPTSPRTDRAHYITTHNDNVLVAAGGRTSIWNNMFYPFSFHILSDNEWETNRNGNYHDAVRIVPNPLNKNELYIATWGYGIVVYDGNEEVANYNPSNSSLESIISGAFCRIGGITFDSNNNLWVSNQGVPNPLSVRTPDGTWKSFPYSSIINSSRQSDIIESPSGELWMVLPFGGGFFVIDPGDNPTSESSHSVRKFQPTSSEGTSLPNEIYSIAFDKDGYLWVGTNEGVLVSYNPERVLEPSSFSMQRVKIPDVVEGLAVFLLESETVTTVAIDGGNRKWFGTQNSGVFLQSTDGSQQIHHFTKGNSPLPSNSIEHIGIHPKSGEVFIATEKGLIGYRSEATEPNDKFENVYAFPNPVRPDYQGDIVITGLVDKTLVKITDVAGNLVYETESLGGQATWNGKNKHGDRVSTGVYLYFCSDKSGEQSAVGKILFVR